MEVNASPGFEGLERVCGVDAAGAILDLAEAISAGLEPRPATARLASGTLLEETEFR